MTTMTNTALQLEQPADAIEPRRRFLRRRPSEDDDTRKTNWWATALIAVCSLTVLVPLYLAVVVALKTPDQLTEGTGFEWPNPVNWGNFAEIFAKAPLLTWIRNTLLYSLLATAFMLVSSIPVAYALAR